MKTIKTMETQIRNFFRTTEKAEITFNGWDGKSYNGESQEMNIWTNPRVPGKNSFASTLQDSDSIVSLKSQTGCTIYLDFQS